MISSTSIRRRQRRSSSASIQGSRRDTPTATGGTRASYIDDSGSFAAMTGWLPEATATELKRCAETTRAILGDALRGVVLVGAALHPERPGRARRPELLAVVDYIDAVALRRLAEGIGRWLKKGIRVRTVTVTEIEDGADVYALELAEWKARHLLIEGEEPFADVEPDPAHLRAALEFALRGLARRVRNRVLAGLGTHGKADDPGRAVIDALDRFAVVAHHALELLGHEPPARDAEVIEAFARAIDTDPRPVMSLLGAVEVDGGVSDPIAAIDGLLPCLEACATAIDRMQLPA